MRESIGPILTSGKLGNDEFPRSYRLLHTELLDVKMTDLPNALPHDDPACGGRVGLQLKTWVIHERISQSLGVETFDGSLECGIQLRLA